jgi:uncharacterized iron-regulated membrane protein
MKYGRQLFSIHSWLGLLGGGIMLLFFLTGGIIVFREELNGWENPHLFRVAPQAQRLPYDQLYREARRQAAGVYLYSFRYIPRTAEETLEMRIYDPARQQYGLLYQNPYNGQVLGTTFRSAYDVLLTLHYTFYLGRVGELLAAIFALALVTSLVTGTLIYRKFLWKALTFRVRIKWKNYRTASSDLHRVLGVWSLLFNLVLAVSGFYMLLYTFDLKTHLGSNPEPVAPPPAFPLDLDQAIRTALGQIPDMQLTLIDFPSGEGQPLVVRGDTPGNWLLGDFNNSVGFDYRSGRQLTVSREEDMSGKEQLEYALYTLHFGQYGGMGIKLLYSFFALCSAVISITGFVLWWRKKRRPAKKQKQPVPALAAAFDA